MDFGMATRIPTAREGEPVPTIDPFPYGKFRWDRIFDSLMIQQIALSSDDFQTILFSDGPEMVLFSGDCPVTGGLSGDPQTILWR